MNVTLRVIMLSLVASFAHADSHALGSPIAAASNAKINLNQADANMLIGSFKHIGKKRAEAIVDYRKKHGEFRAVADLAQVRGLGKTFVQEHLAELQAVFSVN